MKELDSEIEDITNGGPGEASWMQAMEKYDNPNTEASCDSPTTFTENMQR